MKTKRNAAQLSLLDLEPIPERIPEPITSPVPETPAVLLQEPQVGDRAMSNEAGFTPVSEENAIAPLADRVKSCISDFDSNWDWWPDDVKGIVAQFLGCRKVETAGDRYDIICAVNRCFPPASRCAYTTYQQEALEAKLQHPVQLAKKIGKRFNDADGVNAVYFGAVGAILDFYRSVWKKFEVWEKKQSKLAQQSNKQQTSQPSIDKELKAVDPEINQVESDYKPQIGDRLCGNTLSGQTVEGDFLGLSMSGMVRLQTDEPNRLNGLMLVDPATVEKVEQLGKPEPQIGDRPSVDCHGYEYSGKNCPMCDDCLPTQPYGLLHCLVCGWDEPEPQIGDRVIYHSPVTPEPGEEYLAKWDGKEAVIENPYYWNASQSSTLPGCYWLKFDDQSRLPAYSNPLPTQDGFTPAESELPLAPVEDTHNTSPLIKHLEAQAQLYLELMTKLMDSRLSPETKRAESTRLQSMRQKIFGAIAQLESGASVKDIESLIHPGNFLDNF